VNYYRLWGAPVGLFPAWTDYGWFYGTAAHISELLGYLMMAGGTNYTFAAADLNGTPIAPTWPPSPGAPSSPWPKIPGFNAALLAPA
jgi:hypothetical protein